ncbi:unnamed protein product [Rotaria sp. Silwood1]|nr:unnamed protein product [Rotaria sp. Silwood1]CAF4745383.1 unnamed protein product [Rotaria sp. Silwood1]
MKRIIDDIINQVSAMKCFQDKVTCLLDLPNENLLMICHYLSIYDIIHCFYTPERPNLSLHYLIHDYYTKINLGVMAFHEYNYLLSLFSHSDNPLRLNSLILHDENEFYIEQHYFFFMSYNTIRSVFSNLTYFTVINRTSNDLCTMMDFVANFSKLEYLYITLVNFGTTIDEFIIKRIFCFVLQADNVLHNFNQQM